MRKRISRKLRGARFLFIAIGTIFLITLPISLSKETINEEHVIVQIAFLIICAVLYYLFDKAKVVEFDSGYMYITGKNSREKIPLKNVYKIKLTMIRINNRSMWKIGYYDALNIQKSVRILPKWFNKHFDEFVDSVKAVNKDLSYKSWSHSFDFDQ